MRWNQAEIFRIHGCKALRLRLDDGRNTLADRFDQKILIVEDIEELELLQFRVGEVPRTSTTGTVKKNFEN